MVCILNGQCSGICGAASFREERLTLAERGKMDVLKINDDDNDDDDNRVPDIFFILTTGYQTKKSFPLALPPLRTFSETALRYYTKLT